MSNFKKILALVLVIAISVGAGIMGTLAYLTSEDSDVNVMTMGNVSIKQHEYERVVDANGNYTTIDVDGITSYELKDFTQNKPLLPIVGDPSLSGPGSAGYDSTPVRMSQVGSYGGMDVFAGKNAQDKFVVVENDGITDAYVRTIVAIEIGSTDGSLIGSSYHSTWTKKQIGTASIGGTNFALIEYVYAGADDVRHDGGILPAQDTAYPSLSQVYIKSAATNEDCKAIDGNGNGKLDILVFSQAVQAAGFSDAQTALDTAFGKITTTNHPWNVKAADDNQLVAALNDELTVQNVELTDDVTGKDILNGAENSTAIDLNGYTLTSENYIKNHGSLTIENGKISSGTPEHYGAIAEGAYAELVLNDVDITSGGGGIGAAGGAEVTINGGSVAVNTASTSGRYNVYAVNDGTVVTINGGEYSFSKTLNQKRAYVYAGDGAIVYITGGTFGPASTRDGYTAGILTATGGKVIITGGTFGFDPSTWVAEGYEAVQSGSTWTVSPKV